MALATLFFFTPLRGYYSLSSIGGPKTSIQQAAKYTTLDHPSAFVVLERVQATVVVFV